MKLYEVTTVRIDLNTLESETVTTIRTEAEMGMLTKPRKLYKTVRDFSYKNDKENYFNNMTITRIQ